MTDTTSVVVERDIAFPPEKIWRALTQPHLMQEWLMKTDFAPTKGHQFKFTGDWGSVDCEVLTIEPNRMLSYSWASFGLESVVTWTLTPKADGTHLRMEQAGFNADQTRFYQGASAVWPGFVAKLEEVVAGLDD